MSRRIGFISRLWNNFKISLGAPRQTVKLVGQDHLGNKYFLKEAGKNLKGGRWVEPLKEDQFSPPEVPVEWEAWLRGRRDDPPIQEELDRNHALMLRTLERAKELEARDNQENGSLLSDGQPSSGVSLGRSTLRDDRNKSSFPVYEDMEVTPGEKSRRR